MQKLLEQIGARPADVSTAAVGVSFVTKRGQEVFLKKTWESHSTHAGFREVLQPFSEVPTHIVEGGFIECRGI